jgi:hypothetical protein
MSEVLGGEDHAEVPASRTMRYGITRLAAGQHPFIPISQEEFTRIKKAKACYLVVLGIEEKLDLLLENYAEFEGGLLCLSLRRAIFRDLDWDGLMDDIQVTNRRLANLLMSVRLYTDQVKRNAAALFGRNGQTTVAILEALAEQRKTCFGLRVLEELRDHIQHRDLPVRHLTYLRGREKATSRTFRHRIRPALQVAALKEDPKFDRDVLRALEERGATVALIPFVREGIEAVGRIHECLRELAGPDIETWCGILQDVLARGREALGEDLTALGVIAEDDEEHCFESQQVFDDLLQRRVVLLRKNRSLSNLSLHFVSGELEEDGG